MGFFDLNIPYHESDRHVSAADTAKLKSNRLKLVIKAAELGYTGVAYNREFKGVMSEDDRCSIPLFPLSSLLKISPSLFGSVKFHRELLNVPVSTNFRQYTRLTVVIETGAQALSLNSGNPILKSYDVVAVRPMHQEAFEQACKTAEVDVIAIDFSEKLPFRLRQPTVKAAIERGVYFEITYSSLVMDAQLRRQMISNAKVLVDWTRGKNLIVSSAAPSASEIRGPYDVANLLSLLGLQLERAKAAVSKNCRCVISNSLRKKHYFKEAIKVELMPSGGQTNSSETLFDDWLKWDPISSGEGDLLLDDISKSFSACDSLPKHVKVLQFSSALNSLSSHGLQAEHITPGIAGTSEGLNFINNFPRLGETEVAADTKGLSEGSFVFDFLHNGGQNLMQRREESSKHEEGKNFFEKMKAAVNENGMSERSCAFGLLHKEGQAFKQIRHEISNNVDFAKSNTGDSDLNHAQENDSLVVSLQEPRRPEELDACPVAYGIDGNVLLQDDSRVNNRCAHDTENACPSDNLAPVEVSIHLNESGPTLTPEESSMSVRSVDGDAVIIPVEEDEIVVDCENRKEPSLMTSDGHINQQICTTNPVEGEKVVSPQNIEEENKFLTTESKPQKRHMVEEESTRKRTRLAAPESKQVHSSSGNRQLKRKTPHQPFLFPFKNKLISKQSRKKIPKLNRPQPP